MLQKQHVPVVLQGMDTKTDEKNTVTGQLVLAKNMVMQKTKKWANRNGHNRIGNGTAPNARTLSSNGIVNTVIGSDSIASIGEVSNSTYSAQKIYTSNSFYFVSPYEHCEILSTGSYVSFKSDGTIVSRYDNNKLSYFSTSPVLASNGLQHHQVSSDSNSNVFATAADGVLMYCYTPTLASSNTNSSGGVKQYARCAGAYTGGKSYVLMIYAKSGNCYGWIWNVTDNTTVSEFLIHTTYSSASAFQIGSVVEWCSDGKWHVAVPNNATTWNLYTVTTTGTVASASPATQTIDALFLASIANTYNVVMNWSGVVWYSGTTTGLTNARPVSYIGSNFTDKVIASKPSRNSSNAIVLSSTGSNTLSGFDSQWLFIDGYVQQGFNFGYPLGYPVSNVFISSTELATFVVGKTAGVMTYSTAVLPTVCKFNGQYYTNANGTVTTIEPAALRLATAGYYSSPVEIASVTATAGVGFLPAGTYRIFLAWRYTDANGKIFYSPAGPTFTKIAAASDYFTLRFYQSILSRFPSERYDSDSLTVWCTEANGNTFYRQGVATYSSNEDTFVIAQNRPIFTDVIWPYSSGLLENGAIPPCGAVSTCLNRIWAPLMLESDTWMFSTTPSPNFGPNFPIEFRLSTTGDHGRAQIAVEMDNKIVLFHEYGIFVTWGDGPDETGANNFAQPILVSQSVGCKYPRSVVLTDNGVMFMSHEGIWIVTKGLTPQYLGKDVEAYNNLTITAAINLTDRHQVWFYSLEGTTLCYDEFHQIWSVFTGEDTKAATLINGTPTFVRVSDGQLLRETAGTYNDAGTTFDCELKSGWISLNSVQGFQRLYKFTWTGAAVNTATLTIYRDWSGSSFETFTIPSGVSSQWQVMPKVQKGEAMQFDIVWPNITGAVEISALAIEAGVKNGTFRVVPSTNRVQGN